MFCLVGLVPQEGLQTTGGAGGMKVEETNNHSVSSNQKPSGRRFIKLKPPKSKHVNEVHGRPEEPGPAPDWISVDQPGAFCEVSIISDHNYSWEKKTGIQLKTSVSLNFSSRELRFT